MSGKLGRTGPGRGRRSYPVRVGRTVIVVLALYLLAAYLLIPLAWERYASGHPSFDDNPRLTRTSDGHPGDPLNVGLIGTEAEIFFVMKAAKWLDARPLGIVSDLEIAADTILGRPDDNAPMSNLYLFDRKEDLAFEKPVGENPRRRNHVRLWRTGAEDGGRPVWIGAASYDARVGFSHTTGQVTHHIAPDVDTERDRLMAELEATGKLSDVYKVSGFHKVLEGTNGGGDPWFTEGDLAVGVLASGLP
ncbi:LssY C-terminal domain-containing protein [Afifella sp. IM 167]|uniref:LssY C-terminal domain-containing protein n=1 Tax=Afifella sp. IM 167 TaxID=2033586 RepID=UPI001CC9130B|nr:LssY C-terminal domain-containing protein [Afifella sp. IM 167]